MENKEKNRELSDNLFPVVGVGASAGGLEAFKRLVRSIPGNSGMAYILVQHLEPTHESMLMDILQKVTTIPVREVVNNVRVEPDHIYVIPSNKLLTANDGRLELSPRPQKKEKNMPIDIFFSSLSEVHREHAIGVVLSGMGTDGTLGLKVIKDHGGFTFAQDQASAAFYGMPQSAIGAEAVDFILSPEDIPMQVAKLFESYSLLLALIGGKNGTDFTYYKQTTIRRRIMRRMGLNKMEHMADYLTYCEENPAEQDSLYHDLLIPVTGFFRDPGTYELLCETIFPQLLMGKTTTNPLRIWVAGCSTGQEAYSMAICLNDYLGEKAVDHKIQIFATDILERSIIKARAGIYSQDDMSGLPSERAAKYFTEVDGGFHINKTIRDMCVFAKHDFVKDPPFANIDLVSCRNVLIYLETVLQKRALTIFHYALNRSGYLLLGRSETTAPTPDLFTRYGNHDRLYARNPVPGKFLQPSSQRVGSALRDGRKAANKELRRDDFRRSADDLVLSRFNPPGVVVNGELEIVQFRGSIGTWLEPYPGKPSLNVLKMAKQGLTFELRSALQKAKAAAVSVLKENIPMEIMGKPHLVTIEIIPLPDTTEPYYMILFRDRPQVQAWPTSPKAVNEADSADPVQHAESERNQHLQKELAQLKDDMRIFMQDQEAVNEELQRANEELLSGSEELQSLNEELETSKEELQSTNEELATSNHELSDRNIELDASRLFSESIVATIREPLLVLDQQMLVKTANQYYYKTFMSSAALTEGKSFYLLEKGQWDTPAIRSMLDDMGPANRQITDFEIIHRFDDREQRVILLNASRIDQTEHTGPMILLAFEDVTDARNREENILSFSRELERQVQERTASLRESNTLLHESNNNLDQFATIASHDLQEPLRKIRTFSILLHQRHGAVIVGEARELIDKISQSAERMSDLIHDVLNFSKVLDASVYQQVDLNVILQNVINDFDLLIEQKKAIITQDPLPVVRAVPLQMNQLFYNLLGNALKFSKPDVSPVVRVSYRMLTQEEVKPFPSLKPDIPYCDIIFQDNGIGIDSKFSEQVFVIFQRLNSRNHFEGTGIGLALCKRIVLNHKGEIYLHSEKGKGTDFHIILPE